MTSTERNRKRIQALKDRADQYQDIAQRQLTEIYSLYGAFMEEGRPDDAARIASQFGLEIEHG